MNTDTSTDTTDTITGTITGTSTSTSTDTTIHRLLDDELAFSPSVMVHYSSHLAMSLAALRRLGAPAHVLQATFDAHARGEAEPRDDHDVLDERRREVARDGIAATVRARVPALVGAPASQLFHPLIRLAYALDVGHGNQVAAALLDWERRYHALDVAAPGGGTRRLTDVATELAGRPAGTWRHTFDLDGIARRPELIASLQGVALDEHTLDDVSTFAIAAHTAADDFITLHLVTGARALRTVSEWVDDDTALRLAANALPAMAVAYAAVGAPPLLEPDELDELRRSPLPPVAAIVERAVADHDPHVIKLADVALVEEQRTFDQLYRYSAARVVGLVPPGRPTVETS